jgi:hypothetical protein
MEKQLEIFGFKESLPVIRLKKIVSKERIAEMNALLKSNDYKGTAVMLSDMQDRLERFEKRIKTK